MMRVLCPSGSVLVAAQQLPLLVSVLPVNRQAVTIRLKPPLPTRFFMYATRLG